MNLNENENEIDETVLRRLRIAVYAIEKANIVRSKKKKDDEVVKEIMKQIAHEVDKC